MWKIVLFLLLPLTVSAYDVVRVDGKVFTGELIEDSETAIILKEKDGTVIRFKLEQVDRAGTVARNQEKKAADQKHVSRPVKVQETEQEWTGEKISIDVKDMDLRDFLLFLADFAGFDIILDPSVKGSLTMKLTDVPWDQVMDLVCRQYGLGYQIYGSSVNVRRVNPNKSLSNKS